LILLENDAVLLTRLLLIQVRVPTHEKGSGVVWEFATDNYDIGFGVFFEWAKSPTNAVTVHISESEDEDAEEEEEEEDEDEGGNLI